MNLLDQLWLNLPCQTWSNPNPNPNQSGLKGSFSVTYIEAEEIFKTKNVHAL